MDREKEIIQELLDYTSNFISINFLGYEEVDRCDIYKTIQFSNGKNLFGIRLDICRSSICSIKWKTVRMYNGLDLWINTSGEELKKWDKTLCELIGVKSKL